MPEFSSEAVVSAVWLLSFCLASAQTLQLNACSHERTSPLLTLRANRNLTEVQTLPPPELPDHQVASARLPLSLYILKISIPELC